MAGDWSWKDRQKIWRRNGIANGEWTNLFCPFEWYVLALICKLTVLIQNTRIPHFPALLYSQFVLAPSSFSLLHAIKNAILANCYHFLSSSKTGNSIPAEGHLIIYIYVYKIFPHSSKYNKCMYALNLSLNVGETELGNQPNFHISRKKILVFTHRYFS